MSTRRIPLAALALPFVGWPDTSRAIAVATRVTARAALTTALGAR